MVGREGWKEVNVYGGEVKCREGMASGQEDLFDRRQMSQVPVNLDQGKEWSGC